MHLFDSFDAIDHSEADILRERFIKSRGEAKLCENLREATVGERLAVDDSAVKIENDRAMHARVVAPASGVRRATFAYALRPVSYFPSESIGYLLLTFTSTEAYDILSLLRRVEDHAHLDHQ